eukprot:Rhum_TRINITY_DN12433_c0_g1::Rhum_TRINITY_DN12433_c0_g1_i1::g.51865::m.51865
MPGGDVNAVAHDVHVLLKVVVVGEEGAGKSSLCRAWRHADLRTEATAAALAGHGEALPEHPTVGVDVEVLTIPTKATPMRVYLWDTAGRKRFMIDDLKSKCFKGADVVIIAVAAAHERAHQEQVVAHHTQELQRHYPDASLGPKIVVAFTKCDAALDAGDDGTQTMDDLRRTLSTRVSGDHICTTTKAGCAGAVEPRQLLVGLLNGVAAERRERAFAQIKRDSEERRLSNRSLASLSVPVCNQGRERAASFSLSGSISGFFRRGSHPPGDPVVAAEVPPAENRKVHNARAAAVVTPAAGSNNNGSSPAPLTSAFTSFRTTLSSKLRALAH